MKKILVTRKLLKECEEKASKVFDAKLNHQAMSVSRQCYRLRTCIVFKTYRSDANAQRLDFYKV